jgi:hypothetical protein
MQADWFGRKRFVVSGPAVVHACSLTRKGISDFGLCETEGPRGIGAKTKPDFGDPNGRCYMYCRDFSVLSPIFVYLSRLKL